MAEAEQGMEASTKDVETCHMYSPIGLDLEPGPLEQNIRAMESWLWGLSLSLRRPDFRASLGGITV